MTTGQDYHVDVTETYTARIEVMAESPDDAEWVADDLVGGGTVDIVKLSLACGPHTDYSKTCEVVPDEEMEGMVPCPCWICRHEKRDNSALPKKGEQV